MNYKNRLEFSADDDLTNFIKKTFLKGILDNN